MKFSDFHALSLPPIINTLFTLFMLHQIINKDTKWQLIMEHLRKNIIYLCFCIFAVYFGAIRPVVNHVPAETTSS